MAVTNAARAAPELTGRDPQIDRLGGAIEPNNQFFLAKASTRSRDWWAAKGEAEGFDWQGIGQFVFETITAMAETSFERACRLAEEEARRNPPKLPAPRPTPATTIEALWYCVKTRGVAALQEPANKIRLRTFDTAARTEINARIDRMMAGKRRAAE